MAIRLLTAFPGWISGRIGLRADREVSSWTKKNEILRALQYGWLRRLLMWSTDHPLVFVLITAATAAGIAFITTSNWVPRVWTVGPPHLDEHFDLSAFAGVPWSVQATLVALVYPIVLSFIALMLQRKANSTVALRVYILESAIVPAGASSIGLLVATGIQYFATLYSTPEFLSARIASLLIFNAAWLLINVLLTGFFLSRTIRFIQEEEQRLAFTRVAVDLVLRSELTASVKQHIFVGSPQTDWGFQAESANEKHGPHVRMYSFREGHTQVTRHFIAEAMLHDVRLHLLRLVVASWCQRARAKDPDRAGPTLIFPSVVGAKVTGDVVLCAVEDGPALTRLERVLVRLSFIYKPSRQESLSFSASKMLEEIVGEIEAAAEQLRYGAAAERLREMVGLHETLLLACAVESQTLGGNAATMVTSPYAWGGSTFDVKWLEPYRDVGQIAVRRLDDDQRLFRTLANIPARLAFSLPPNPEKLLVNVQMLSTNLAYQLGGWWTRKADASLLPGATTFSGKLPEPLNKLYEQALLAFIGSWSQFDVNLASVNGAADAQRWKALTARAHIYAKHVDNSSHLFLKAVSRGDETGATRLLDNLLKWWGNRQHALACGDLEGDFRVRNVTLTLADRDWTSAQTFLWDGSEPITIEFGEKALNLGLRRYWESMRLYVALLLVQNAGSPPAADSRELRYAAALIQGTAVYAGGQVSARPLDSFDALLRAILREVFGVETAMKRIDGFAENLRWESEAPEVPGWIYSWSGFPAEMESMKRAQVTLLIALAAPRRNVVVRSKEIVERWWNDIDKLESVARYCSDLRREVLSGEFGNIQIAVATLQQLLGRANRIRSCRLAVAVGLKRIRAVACHERLITLRARAVDERKVRALRTRIAARAFEATNLPAPIGAIEFVPGLSGHPMSCTFHDDKKSYLYGMGGGVSDLAEHMGEFIRRHLVAWSFRRTLADRSLQPVNSPALHALYDAAPAVAQDYVSAVATRCSTIRAQGGDPLVLVGRTAAGSLMSPHKWGTGSWQYRPPSGVTLERADTASGAFAVINGTPVFDFDTPNGDCYVVSAEALKILAIGGSDASSSMSIEWTLDGEDRLKFSVQWQAAFL